MPFEAGERYLSPAKNSVAPEHFLSGSRYAERISVAAIPYKIWVYETGAKIEDGDGHDHKPSFAPLLIGQCPRWHPTDKGPAAASVEMWMTSGLCVILLAVWLVFRMLRPNRKIEWKLSK